MFSVIFPGQGSQIVCMGKVFHDKFDLVKNLFKEADDTLNFPISKLILEGPKEELDLTANTQPAIFLISYSIFKVIKKNKKGSYIHFKIKAKGNVIDELEKNEAIDKKLLRYLTVRVKKFDLEANYFAKREGEDKYDKKESYRN